MDTGDSEYVIDMPDLMAFVTDGYWLWTACWKQSQMDRFENIMMMAMGDGGEMSIFSSLMELESSFEPESISGESTSDAKLSTQEFVSAVISIQAILRKTDQLLEDGGIDTDELRKTQEILTDFLLELNESRK